MSEMFDEIRDEMIDHLDHKGVAAIQQTLRKLLARAAQTGGWAEAENKLQYWVDNWSNELPNLADLFATTFLERERALRDDLQAITGACQQLQAEIAAMEKALPQINKHIEKVILIVGIQCLQADPRQQARLALEQARQNLERNRARADLHENILRGRLAEEPATS